MGTPTGWEYPEWRRWKVESTQRRLAMLHQGDQLAGLTRDDAQALNGEVQALQGRLAHLRAELGRLSEKM